MHLTFLSRAALIAFTVACAHQPLRGQTSACESEAHPIAAQTLAELRMLASRTDTAAARIRAVYHYPSSLTPSEIVPVASDSICAQAAQLFMQKFKRSTSVTLPVFVVRLRNIYFIQDPTARGASGDDRKYVFSMVADSSLSSALETFRGM